jgi:hypothetical protein
MQKALLTQVALLTQAADTRPPAGVAVTVQAVIDNVRVYAGRGWPISLFPG